MENRPISPHLQVYKLPFPAILSILHRFTGVGLAVGLWVGIAGLFFLSHGPESYQRFCFFAFSTVGKICLWGWLFSLYYHLLNGIRHLAWDAGYGFSIKQTYVSGVLVVIGTIILVGLTALFF